MKQTKNSPVQSENNFLNLTNNIILKKIRLLPFIPKLIMVVALGTILIVSISLVSISVQETKKTSLITSTPFIKKNNQYNTQPRITGAWEVNPTSENIIPTLEPTNKPQVRKKLDLGEISWLQFPQPIKLDIFNKTEYIFSCGYNYSGSGDYDIRSVKMHKTGAFSDGSYLVNLYIDAFGMGLKTELHRFIFTPTKQIYLLEDGLCPDLFTASVQAKIIDINIKGIEAPQTIKLPDITINLTSLSSHGRDSLHSFTQIINPQKFFDSPYGPIYISYPIKKNYEPMVSRYFYLRHPDDTISSYKTEVDFFSDDMIPQFTFLDGTKNKDQYYTGLKTGGCGGVENGFIKSNDLNNNDLTQIGTIISDTSEYRNIYQITNPKNNIVNLLFKDFSAYNSSNQGITSVEEYAKLPTHFLWQDNLGDWNIFGNEEYGNGAECAKPVIYLYPPKETQVKVQVGAQITQSEPVYPEGGWLVTAKSNGELTYQNQSYPYLFWEGLGNGLYPDYRNRGTVVAQKDLVFTLYKQLSQLGLNQKESADFMEFWQPKLPKTPYVRLTWLNTKDMNTLAPLAVTPRPDTSIRIFLEFQGLDQPIKLIPQTLTAPARQGFTLIEWGGLLLKTRE